MGTPIDIFDYYLPENLIAKYPCPNRDECRLMELNGVSGKITHKIFSDLPDILTENDFLVVNNTKVRKARLDAQKPTGGKSELFVTEILNNNTFKAIVRGRFKSRDILNIKTSFVTLLQKDDDGVWLAECPQNIEKIMDDYGHIPLPPYINRADETSDGVNYQTVYAKNEGSVAAATAGLHFTKELLEKLKNKGVELIEITLDVGLGTFRPVKTDTIEEHTMHYERYAISQEAAERINIFKSSGKRLIAVGSTTVRALESAIIGKQKIESGENITNILITPPYRFRMTDSIITNFHLPKSTLIAMVAAFGGYENIMNAYAQAVCSGYRFFSYGDAMFINNTIV